MIKLRLRKLKMLAQGHREVYRRAKTIVWLVSDSRCKTLYAVVAGDCLGHCIHKASRRPGPAQVS